MDSISVFNLPGNKHGKFEDDDSFPKVGGYTGYGVLPLFREISLPVKVQSTPKRLGDVQ